MQVESLTNGFEKMEWRDFGNVEKQKKDLVDGICELDVIAKGRPLTEDDRLRKEEISRDLEKFILLEEVSSRHKSRALQLREGDKNTKFFS
jgi:hypothetical protein